MSDTTSKINSILEISDSYQAPQRLMEILYDREKRESIFREFLELFNYKVSLDFFTQYFQEEHSDRRNLKQDFTPPSVSMLMSHLIGDMTGGDGSFYEPCAGTGGMTIARWNSDRMQHSPFDYKPSMYTYTCEELSDRAIPFLLFNLMIRGMNAIVIHCDVLSRKAYGAFFIQNDKDDHMMFSSLNRLPYSETVEKTLAVNFVEERYGEIIDTKELPKHIFGDITLEMLKTN